MASTYDFMSPVDERLSERLVWAIAGALLVVHVILVWRSRELGLISAQDDARYMLLARSLLDGSYRDLYLVGLPYHSSYPPAFPALLAAWSLVFGESFGGFVILNVGISVVALAIAFLAIKRGWSAAGGLVCLTCMAVNPFLVLRPGGVRSETLYIALSFLALWALATRRPSARMLWIAGAAAIAATLTRSIGLSLIAAIGVVWLLERRYRAFGVFAIASLATAGAWLMWGAFAPGQTVGYHYFADALGTEGAFGLVPMLARRIGQLLPNYAALTMPWTLALPTVPGTPLDNVLISLLTPLAVIVGMLGLVRRWPVAIVYMLFYGALLVVWPYHRPRFMEPLVPLLLATLLLGVGATVARFSKQWAIPAVGVVAVLLLFGSGLRTASLVQQRQACEEFSLTNPPECLQTDRASYLRAVAYIGANSSEDAVFVTAKPEALYYYTNRRSVLLQATFVYEEDAYLDELRRQGVDYVLIGSLHVDELNRLAPRLRRHCDEMQLEAFFPPRTYLLRLDREPGEAGAVAGGQPDVCRALEDYREANADRQFVDDSG